MGGRQSGAPRGAEGDKASGGSHGHANTQPVTVKAPTPVSSTKVSIHGRSFQGKAVMFEDSDEDAAIPEGNVGGGNKQATTRRSVKRLGKKRRCDDKCLPGNTGDVTRTGTVTMKRKGCVLKKRRKRAVASMRDKTAERISTHSSIFDHDCKGAGII